MTSSCILISRHDHVQSFFFQHLLPSRSTDSTQLITQTVIHSYVLALEERSTSSFHSACTLWTWKVIVWQLWYSTLIDKTIPSNTQCWYLTETTYLFGKCGHCNTDSSEPFTDVYSDRSWLADNTSNDRKAYFILPRNLEAEFTSKRLHICVQIACLAHVVDKVVGQGRIAPHTGQCKPRTGKLFCLRLTFVSKCMFPFRPILIVLTF